MKYCDYVNSFFASEEYDVTKSTDGLSSKWFYLKGMCGNTHPGAVEPFGKMSVCAYSGGYPTGYGVNRPNSCGKIKRFLTEKSIMGLSHFHQYGVGAIGKYYNYAVVTPIYNDADYKLTKLTDEFATPSYYKCKFDNTKITAEVTTYNSVAYHRYTMKTGKIKIDMSNEGLSREFGEKFYSLSKQSKLQIIDDETVFAEIDTYGIKKYIAVKIEDCNNIYLWQGNKIFDQEEIEIPQTTDRFGFEIFVKPNPVVKVCISIKSKEDVLNKIKFADDTFDMAREKCQNKWENYLGRIDADFDNKDSKKLFYTLFYQSLIKPSNFENESFLYDEKDFYGDISTMWDIYKTQLPLIFSLYKNESNGLLNTFLNSQMALKKFPNSIVLSNDMNVENNQAKMIMAYSLVDGKNRGYDVDLSKIINEKYEDIKYPPHILDIVGACENIDNLTTDYKLEDAFDSDGMMKKDNTYYEGDWWNYSFRLVTDMQKRIALCGKDEFENKLDIFFGFKDITPQQYLDDKSIINDKPAMKNLFEGFNNEPDMETPYNYLFIDKHKKLCKIIKSSFDETIDINSNGGFSGNVDSGGLSSCLLWNMLGIFPVSGQNKMLVGFPICKNATINLYNGNKINITNNTNKEFVKSCKINSVPVSNWTFSVNDFMNGMDIVFE